MAGRLNDVLELTIATIILVLGFIGVAWYARYRSQQRSQAFAQKTRVTEPKVDNDFGQYLEEQLERQEQNISTELEPDADAFEDGPVITLSSDATAAVETLTTDNVSTAIPEQNKPISREQAELDLVLDSEPLTSPTPVPPVGNKVVASDADKLEAVSDTKTKNSPTTAPKDKEWDIVLALTILSADDAGFRGMDIQAALSMNDVVPGEMQIYHRYHTGRSGQALFSVANLLTPGTLKPDELSALETKGLVVFMRLPSPVNGSLAFDAMLDAADKITKQLNGRLCDDKRRTLTETTLEAMRSRILNFNLSQQVDKNQFEYDYSR